MKRTVLASLLAALALAPVAHAHYVPRADAESRWYYIFKGHCGNVYANWDCVTRRYDGPRAYSHAGEHGYFLTYTYRERHYLRIWDTRLVRITGRLRHMDVYDWQRTILD